MKHFFVNLSTPAHATIADAQGVATITDNDTSRISISDVAAVEGDAGTVAVVFTVSLSVPNSRPVTVDYETGTNGTATSGTDYQTAVGGLAFSPGATSRTITILVNGDPVDEANETFFVNLFHVVEATVSDGIAKASISDDDAPPTVSISDVTIVEGNSGSKTAVLTLTLSAPSGLIVKLNYQTADGTATTPDDYTAKTGTVSFAAGIVSRTITVSVRGDVVDEADEKLFVNFLTAQNATMVDAQGVITIADNDR
jgi:hypothetical protein